MSWLRHSPPRISSHLSSYAGYISCRLTAAFTSRLSLTCSANSGINISVDVDTSAFFDNVNAVLMVVTMNASPSCRVHDWEAAIRR